MGFLSLLLLGLCYVCSNVVVLGLSGSIGGEWIRGLGLDFTNPV